MPIRKNAELSRFTTAKIDAERSCRCLDPRQPRPDVVGERRERGLRARAPQRGLDAVREQPEHAATIGEDLAT